MYKNKKFKKSKSKKKSIAVVVLGALLIAGLALAYSVLKPDNQVSLDQQQQEMAEEMDSERAKREADEARGSASDPLKDQDEVSPDVVTGNIQLGQPAFEQSGGVVRSSVVISGASSGRCSFVFSTMEDRPVSRDVDMSSGSCVVSIPEVEFAKLGEWNLVVSFAGQSVKRTVNIN